MFTYCLQLNPLFWLNRWNYMYEVMGMGSKKLEEKLLKIEKKKPFENDEDMLRAVEHIMNKERKKRATKQDFDLINECGETSLMLKGYDVDKLNKYIESTQEETLNKLHERIRLEQAKVAHAKPRRYRLAFVSMCVVVTLVLMSVAGYAIGFEPIRRIVNEIFNITVGGSISEGDREYIRSGETVYFETIEELLDDYQFTVLYPAYLPQGITLNKIGDRTGANNNSTFTFEFSNDALSYIIDTYEVFDHSTLEGQIPAYESNDIVYHILDEEWAYIVYFEYQNIQYTLQYNDYDELIKIINSIEEYK